MPSARYYPCQKSVLRLGHAGVIDHSFSVIYLYQIKERKKRKQTNRRGKNTKLKQQQNRRKKWRKKRRKKNKKRTGDINKIKIKIEKEGEEERRKGFFFLKFYILHDGKYQCQTSAVRYRGFGSPFSSKRLWFVADCLVTLSTTSYWNIKMALIAAHLNAGIILVVTV